MSYLDFVFFADNMYQSGSLEPSSLQDTDSSLQPTGSSTQPVASNTTGDSNQPVASGSNSWRARYSVPLAEAITTGSILAAATKVSTKAITLVTPVSAKIVVGVAIGTFAGTSGICLGTVHMLKNMSINGPGPGADMYVEVGSEGISGGISTPTDSAVSKFLLDALDSLDVSLFLDSFNSIVGLILVALTVVMF